jgi:hypothetical protein
MIKREAPTVPLEAKHAYKSHLLRSLVLPNRDRTPKISPFFFVRYINKQKTEKHLIFMVKKKDRSALPTPELQNTSNVHSTVSMFHLF